MKAQGPSQPPPLANSVSSGTWPPVLYKYSGVSGERLERVRALVVDSVAYFASPASFNDPLDCRTPPRFDASRLAIEAYWRTASRRVEPRPPARDLKRRIKEQVDESRTPEGRQRLADEMFRYTDGHGIVCLSRSATNMLLWSYYAEGHSGLAVRFNMDPEFLIRFPRFMVPLEVQYRDEFPDVNYFLSTTEDVVRAIFATKATAWQHEEEWRLVLTDGPGKVGLPDGMIDGVVLGMRTSSATEKQVRAWLAERPGVTLQRVEHCPRSFSLRLVDLQVNR